MGLDITVYTNAVRTKDDYEDEDSIICQNESCFETRRGDMEEGTYIAEIFTEFCAGSYKGYNHWRDELCKAVYGIPASEFWECFSNTFEGPFAELINFTDCEGFIGTSVCKKLADDFDKHKDALDAIEDEYWEANRKHWHYGFRTAGDNNGFVSFQ